MEGRRREGEQEGVEGVGCVGGGGERMNESCTVCVGERVIKVGLFAPLLPLPPRRRDWEG